MLKVYVTLMFQGFHKLKKIIIIFILKTNLIHLVGLKLFILVIIFY